MEEPLKGYKTYLVAGGMLVYAVLGFTLGYLDAGEAGTVIMEAFGLIALRLGIAKTEL